jgi:hypothetical protein
MNSFLAAATSAMLWFAVMGLAGIGLTVSGLYILFGTGWACVAAGLFLLGGTVMTGKGMRNG